MSWKKEWKPLLLIAVLFLGIFNLPVGAKRFEQSILESLYLARWYAREHVILCLLPAFFIAGAISVFISQASVMKYLGAKAKKVTAYAVASLSGTILAVCSCTVLPLFAGIYRMGAGLGPATTFLYSGPAINILAIVLTTRVLGIKLGIARAVGAIFFSIVIGLFMHFIYRKEELAKSVAQADMPIAEEKRALWQNALYFASMVSIMVFATFAKPSGSEGIWYFIYSIKWLAVGLMYICLSVMLVVWFGLKWWKMLGMVILTSVFCLIFPDHPEIPFIMGLSGISILISSDKGELGEWFSVSWGFAKQILPLLLMGVIVAGFLLGRPDGEGIIPSHWISNAVGGNSFVSNFFASIAGAFMYFATLTEVPILQGLLNNGMGQGPALSLLLAGPALSLPNMLVIRSVMGTEKTLVYVVLVVCMATISGIIYGGVFG